MRLMLEQDYAKTIYIVSKCTSLQYSFSQVHTRKITNRNSNLYRTNITVQKQQQKNSQGFMDIKLSCPQLPHRKLKAAKEKLKHLQSLVAMVQHAPDSAGSLPDNIAEMAASMDDGEPQYAQADDRNNASLSEGEVPSGQAER